LIVRRGKAKAKEEAVSQIMMVSTFQNGSAGDELDEQNSDRKSENPTII